MPRTSVKSEVKILRNDKKDSIQTSSLRATTCLDPGNKSLYITSEGCGPFHSAQEEGNDEIKPPCGGGCGYLQAHGHSADSR